MSECSRPIRFIRPPRLLLAGVAAAVSALLVAPAALADGPASTTEAAEFEVGFLEGMIDHHGMATHMAELCLAKAETPALLRLCESIIEDQAAEIEQMQGWLGEWYGPETDTVPDMSEEHHQQMLALGELSGDEFEIRFLEMMSEHHAMAVEDARECLREAEHSELRKLCRGIVSSQLREIGRMESWLCRWYGDCDFTYLRSL